MPFEKRRTSTRSEIIKTAAKMFIEEGVAVTTNAKIAKKLGLSSGNITFYFPTRAHLLAVMVNELCDFQRKMMENEINEGKSNLLSYCLELTAIAAICEEDLIAKEFYVACYTNELTIQTIRANDHEKTKEIFSEYNPTWTDAKWREMENLVSGLEYATIITTEANTPLHLQIESTLDAVMLLYNVPESIRKQKIEKVLAIDYRALGRRILKEFKDYIEKINDQALLQAKIGRK